MTRNIDVKFRNPYNNCILRKIIYHQYLTMRIDLFDPLGAQTDRLRCEVCQNLISDPMNTGVLRPAVATVLTVYGIETDRVDYCIIPVLGWLQQYLPFTVLKPSRTVNNLVAGPVQLQQYLPFTVLKPFYQQS